MRGSKARGSILNSRMRGKRMVNQARVGNYQSIRTTGNRQNSKSNKGCLLLLSQLSGLPIISYRIMLKRSDGTHEESTTLNTFPVRGGVAHHAHTNGKHLGYIYINVLAGADETYARTHPKH